MPIVRTIQEPMDFLDTLAQSAATANGTGTAISLKGYNGDIYALVTTTAGSTGSCTVTPQGSWDGGTTYVSLGYQEIDAIASPARAVGGIAISGASQVKVYQILDAPEMLQFPISATAGTLNISVRVKADPL